MENTAPKETCEACGGYGYTIEIEAECCGNYNEHGCCGVPNPVQVQVECMCSKQSKIETMNKLEIVKDELANEHYSVPSWTLLDDSQRAALVDLVAVIYHSNLKRVEA